MRLWKHIHEQGTHHRTSPPMLNGFGIICIHTQRMCLELQLLLSCFHLKTFKMFKIIQVMNVRHKWKTNHCEEEFYFMCNAYDHKPKFKLSSNDKFALLTDRTLTRAESASLCQNLYGYGLATIYSYHELSEINQMLTTYSITDAWIGLNYDADTIYDGTTISYGWMTQTDFIFDDWTQLIWINDAPFPDPPTDGECIRQINGSQWRNTNCNDTSHAVCNYDLHLPQFTRSQLGSFYLLENQLQSYANGVQMCRDYIGLRSTGAIIYHPLENDRAIWLCSNTTNGKGCFIGYNNIQYRNQSAFRWANGALIDVFGSPWFGNPWLNVSNTTRDVDALLTQKYEIHNDTDYCGAIVYSEERDTWGWDVVDCDEELNILCDS
eukprot:865763_1